jgi:putative endonuclease
VFRDGNTIVFVEVRYRANSRFGDGLASVNAAKRRKLGRAAASWLKQNSAYRHSPCRFDVVSVSGPASDPALKWIKRAFDT